MAVWINTATHLAMGTEDDDEGLNRVQPARLRHESVSLLVENFSNENASIEQSHFVAVLVHGEDVRPVTVQSHWKAAN